MWPMPDAAPLFHGRQQPRGVILAERMLPRKHEVLIPGPQSHAAKVAFAKYFLWKTRHGYVGLP